MNNVKKNSYKLITAVVTAIMIMLSIIFNTQNVSSTATSSSRTYWKHDYSNPNLALYTDYTLSVNTINNNPPAGINTIFPPNNMVRDYDTSVVRLSIGGTGFIIGNHVIATAGHCVYSQEDDEFINFTIDIVDTDNSVIETIYPRYVHVNQTFAQSNSYSPNYDYALIYVTEDLSSYGSFKMGAPLSSYISSNGQVIVSGFPQEYPAGYNGLDWGIRFKASGNIISATSKVIHYDADMINGDSGGPVYVEEAIYVNNQLSEYKTVIAINVAQDNNYNYGVRVNSDILKFYYGNSNI